MVALIGVAFIAGCKHDPDLENIKEITFSGDAQRIIVNSCATVGCHAADSRLSSLSNYTDIIKNGAIKPGDPRGSKLYQLITHRSFQVMPPAPATVSNDDVTKIYLWILAGAKNN